MSHAPYRSQSTSSETGPSPITVALLTSGGIMFASGATAAVLSVPRAVTIAYYLSTLIVVCISLSFGIAMVRRRESTSSHGSSTTRSNRGAAGSRRTNRDSGQDRIEAVIEDCHGRLVAAVGPILAALNRKQRDRL